MRILDPSVYPSPIVKACKFTDKKFLNLWLEHNFDNFGDKVDNTYITFNDNYGNVIGKIENKITGITEFSWDDSYDGRIVAAYDIRHWSSQKPYNGEMSNFELLFKNVDLVITDMFKTPDTEEYYSDIINCYNYDSLYQKVVTLHEDVEYHEYYSNDEWVEECYTNYHLSYSKISDFDYKEVQEVCKDCYIVFAKTDSFTEAEEQLIINVLRKKKYG